MYSDAPLDNNDFANFWKSLLFYFLYYLALLEGRLFFLSFFFIFLMSVDSLGNNKIVRIESLTLQ